MSPAFSAAYDGDGLRAKKTAGGVTTYYVYDGDTPVAEESFNGTSATFTALNGITADGWRARKQGSLVYDFVYDPQGSVQQRQTDTAFSSGLSAYDRSTFEGYGALRQANKGSTGAGVGQHDPAGFGGQFGYYTDTETGLLCLTHRYYDPGTGKFINRDPIGYAGGANLYGFCGGNPVNESDPSGLATVEVHYRNVFHPGFHAFLIIIDNDGTKYYISGGPATEISHADKTRERDHLLTVNEGLYKPGTPDWPYNGENGFGFGGSESDRPKPDVLVRDSKPASFYIKAFMKVGNRINSSRIRYDWKSTNSNATIREILQRSSTGLPIPGPSNQPRNDREMWNRPWTTSWDTPLPIK